MAGRSANLPDGPVPGTGAPDGRLGPPCGAGLGAAGRGGGTGRWGGRCPAGWPGEGWGAGDGVVGSGIAQA